jgi:hypothetical protein
MQSTKKGIVRLAALSAVLALGLAACTDDSAEPQPSAPSEPAPTASSPAPSVSAPAPSASASVPPASETPQDPAAELPETKSFTVSLEGNEEERVGTLAIGDGYALYVFEQFTFDPEKGRLAMNYDNNYYVDITKLPADYSLDQLQQEGEAKLAETGEVKALEGEERDRLMQDAALVLHAFGDQGSKYYMVREVDGTGYLFEVNVPQGEATEGFVPLAFTTLRSIVNL